MVMFEETKPFLLKKTHRGTIKSFVEQIIAWPFPVASTIASGVFTLYEISDDLCHADFGGDFSVACLKKTRSVCSQLNTELLLLRLKTR